MNPKYRMRKIKKADQGLNLEGIFGKKKKKYPKPPISQTPNVYTQDDTYATSGKEDSELSLPTNDISEDQVQLRLEELEQQDALKKNRYNNILGTTLLGLGILTDILPDNMQRRKLVQPQIEFNPNQYGTGSQAIYAKGGTVSSTTSQNTTLKPIYTSNTNDPRLKAYQDSLNLHKGTLGTIQDFKNIVASASSQRDARNKMAEYTMNYQNSPRDVMATTAYKNLTRLNGMSPHASETYYPEEGYGTAEYKKPVQPIIYQKPNFHQRPKGGIPSNTHTGAIPQAGAAPMGRPSATNRPTSTDYSYSYRDDKGQQQSIYFQNWDQWNTFVKDQPFIDAPTNAAKSYGHATGHYLKYDKGGKLSPEKAREMLKDGTAHGKKLTKKQKRYFGMVAHGKAEYGMELFGPGDPAAKRLNFDQIEEWNKFMGKAKGKNLTDLFGQYKKSNPKGTIDFESLRSEFDLINNRIREGQASETNEFITNANVGYKFPEMKYDGKSYGPMNADLKTRNPIPNKGGYTDDMVQKYVPDYVTELEFNNEVGYPYYVDQGTGDITYVSRHWQNHPRFNKNRAQGATAKLKNGGNMLGQLSQSDIFEFKGPSHENGGIPIQFGGQTAEVEGGETAFVSRAGDLEILGNMYYPGTKVKFKKLGKEISEREQKNNKALDKGVDLVNKFHSPINGIERIKMSTGKVLLEGGLIGKKLIDDDKERLAAIQNAMLSSAPKAKFDDGGKLPGKFNAVKSKAEELLKTLYPNAKVEVRMGGGDRDIKEQRGLLSKKATKTSVSLHNFGAARDFLIYVDGKLIQDPKVYKSTVQAAAKEQGLFHLADWDPGHIGAVQEGKGNTFGDLVKAYPEVLTSDSYKNSLGFLKNLVDNGKADKQEIAAYNQLTGSKIDPSKAIKPNYKEAEKYVPTGEGTWFNQTFIPSDKQVELPPVDNGNPADTPQKPYVPFEYTPNEYTFNQNLKNPAPYQSPLDVEQVAPEIYSMFTNRQEPVPAQFYNPQLYEQYQVSLQDQRNANQATFNATQRVVGNNPEALAVLNAQKYAADSQVTGEEFRINQGIFNDISNRNIGLQNDAQLKNLGIADTQMVRQSQAASKTKAETQLGLNSLASKTLQNRLENLDSAFKQMLFKHRPVDKDGDGVFETLEYQGNAPVFTSGAGNPNDNPYQKTRATYDQYGNLKQTTVTEPSDIEKPVLNQKARRANLSSIFDDARDILSPLKLYKGNKKTR